MFDWLNAELVEDQTLVLPDEELVEDHTLALPEDKELVDEIDDGGRSNLWGFDLKPTKVELVTCIK